MIGWVILFTLAAAALLLLWRPGRLDRPALTLTAAALFLAAAGYAWQGSPGAAGAPAAGQDRNARHVDTLFAIERQSLLDHFGEAGEDLGTADALHRWGEDQAAVSYMQGVVGRHPRNVSLRVGLAHALLVQAGGNVDAPAVQLAFQRAIALGGGNPAPAYFYGLAYLEAGAPGDAATIWRQLDATLPPGSPWHQVLTARLRLIDMIAAMQARAHGMR